MRLVSLNTWKAEGDYPKRLQAMAQDLAALSADVIALQEDLRTADGQTHTADSLAQALGLHMSWLPAREKPRDVGQHRTMTTSGLAVLSRWPLLEQRSLVLPEDPRDGERLAQALRLPREAGDGWLLNLHLTHLPDRADLRQAQLAAALRWAATLANGQPVLLCGDFNAAADAPELQPSLHPFGPLSNAFGMPKVTHVTSAGEALDLDHVFLMNSAGAAPWRVVGSRVVLDHADLHGAMPSDHFGVCVDLDRC